MGRSPKKIGEILIEKGLISPEQLEDALKDQKRTKDFLGAILIKSGSIKEDDLSRVLSEQYGIPFISIRYDYIDWDFVGRFSPALILENKCFPLKSGEYHITVAITNPLDALAIKRAEEETKGYKLRLVLISVTDMREAIQRYKERIQRRGA